VIIMNDSFVVCCCREVVPSCGFALLSSSYDSVM
jgi:hypothetical protein